MSLNSNHIHLDDIRLDRVKSRRGRPKRTKNTKKPFWNFSKKTSVVNEIERRQRKLKMQAKSWKSEGGGGVRGGGRDQSRETDLWSKLN